MNEESEDNSGFILVCIISFILFIGFILAYEFVWLPKKEKQERIEQQKEEEEPIKWIYHEKDKGRGDSRIGLITIEEHLYIATQYYSNGTRLIHSESCLNPKHITK